MNEEQKICFQRIQIQNGHAKKLIICIKKTQKTTNSCRNIKNLQEVKVET